MKTLLGLMGDLCYSRFMSIQIVYGDECYFEGFWKVLDSVAREKNYLEIIEAPPRTEVDEFQKKLIHQKFPVFYALGCSSELKIEVGQVVGWIDIVVFKNPRMAHRGTLGMGLLSTHRGQGIGSKLMEKALDYSRSTGLEKIELQVYPENSQAIELYKKFGFKQCGYLKHYRKVENRYFDSLTMEVFL